jgi:predicted nucleic acid-binding protein
MRPDHNLQEASGHETSDLLEVVVADTSPLNYLVQINCDFLLPSLYRCVVAPPPVVAELSHDNAPLSVTSWASQLPEGLEVLSIMTPPDAKLCRLDPGERDAIQLALELHASAVPIDEVKGRQEARSRGLSIIGTLGILLEGQQADLVDAYDGLDRLTRLTTFRITPQLRQQFFAAVGSRTGKG